MKWHRVESDGTVLIAVDRSGEGGGAGVTKFFDKDGNPVQLCRACGSMVADGKCLNCGCDHLSDAGLAATISKRAAERWHANAADAWDEQIEKDIAVGRLDALANEVVSELKNYSLDLVASCTTCPFMLLSDADDSGHLMIECGHGIGSVARLVTRTAKKIEGEFALVVLPPAWCPLRERSTLVRLRSGV